MIKKETVLQLALVVALALITVLWVFPLLWILSTSLKSEGEIIQGGLNLVPRDATLATYQAALFDSAFADQMPVLRWFMNSLIIAVAHTAVMLLVSSMAAFAYARLEFTGRTVLFYLQLSTMLVPQVVTLVPLYRMMVVLGWVNSYWAMILPGVGSVFAVFLLRQFMMSIPKDYDEAARIDGAGVFSIYFRIILPLVRPALIVTGLFVFLANWNDFLWPTIITSDVSMRTLPAGLRILQGFLTTQYGKIAVASVVSALPVFIIFLFARRYFTKGLSLSAGIKG